MILEKVWLIYEDILFVSLKHFAESFHQANKLLFQFDSKDLKIPKEMVYFLPGTLQCYDIPVYLRNTKVYIPTTT